jgi:serine/threonine protein kinase
MTVAVEPSALDSSGPRREEATLPQVFGRYLLVQRLSRGGMGEIFVAKHGLAGFEKLCVIKKVLPNLAEDQQFISRFVDEAQVAIKLSHVNIAQVFEVGRVGDEYFLALEHVEGRDLRRTLTVLAHKAERFPVDLALFVGREIANGLAYAHRRTSTDGTSLGLVHCDISPPNVLVSFEGETKLIDFGIAKSVLRATATDPRMGFGKFGYMAPEQLIRGGVVDHRTDIYATGCVLYELLTGQRLYEVSENPDYRALARMVARGEHKVPSDHDPMLAPYDDLVSRALKPKQDDRYQSAAELRDDIQAALVTVNPTISTDQLGEFMHRVFADEMGSLRENKERLAALHLADFKNELTTQSVETISFALANMPLYAPPTTQVDLGAHAAPVHPAAAAAAQAALGAPPPRGRSNGDVTDEITNLRPRRRWLLPAILGGALVVGAAAFAMSAGSTTQTEDSGQLGAAGASATGAGSGSGTAAPAALPPDAAPRVAAGSDQGSAVAPAAPIDAGAGSADEVEMPVAIVRSPPSRGGGSSHHHGTRHGGSHDTGHDATPAVSAAQVQAKFRRVLREYRAFKRSYGARLEPDWADIATFAQYARTPDKLLQLDKKLDHFRAEMKSAH